MPTKALIDELAEIAARRLGGNLRLLGIFGSAVGNPIKANDIDFLLVVEDVESCVTYATQDCRDHYQHVQFFVLSAAEYAMLPSFYRFQFAFVQRLKGDLEAPKALRSDAIESIRIGFTDTLRTLRQQLKRREWAAGDDWARQVWWNLKSSKYALLDVCWLLRHERPTDVERAALILAAEGLPKSAAVVTEWPKLEVAAGQLLSHPLDWVVRWDQLISSAYTEVRPYLITK